MTARRIPLIVVSAAAVALSLSGCIRLGDVGASSKTVSCHYLSDAVETGDKSIHAGPTYVDDPQEAQSRVQAYADGVRAATARAQNPGVKDKAETLVDALSTLADAMQQYAADPQSGADQISFVAATVDQSVNDLAAYCKS
jgi:hypothetical protein